MRNFERTLRPAPTFAVVSDLFDVLERRRPLLKPEIFLGEGSDGSLVLLDESDDLLGEGVEEGPDILFILSEFLLGVAGVS